MLRHGAALAGPRLGDERRRRLVDLKEIIMKGAAVSR